MFMSKLRGESRNQIMKFFRVYRVFSWKQHMSELSRQNYLFSVVVSDTEADYVVNPVIDPDTALNFLRSRLSKIVGSMEEAPSTIEEWASAATYNLGLNRQFSLVLEVNEEAQPLANFNEIRAREKSQVDNWVMYKIQPTDFGNDSSGS